MPAGAVKCRWQASAAFGQGYVVTLSGAGIDLPRPPDRWLGSSTCSFHWLIHPTVRATANSTVNMLVGKPIALRMMPE